MSHWVDLAPAGRLAIGSAKAFRRAGEQVAIFRLTEDEFFAIDNRCPHEGYAMVQGYVQKHTVTCAWHNFKFDLKSGRCLMGDEAIRTFPLRLQEGRLEVELVPPDPQKEQQRALRSLEEGLLEGRVGQAARDMVRALHFGLPPRQLAFELCRIDASYARYGLGHATAGAVDALRYEGLFKGEEMALPLLISARLVARDRIRLPRRKSYAAIVVDEAHSALRQAVEQEDIPQAVGLFRGLWQERDWSTLRSLFFTLCSDHLYSFGHPLIYLVKVDELLHGASVDGLEFDRLGDLLEGLLVGIINGTRHDALPPWRRWMVACEPLGQRLGTWSENEGLEPDGVVVLAEAWGGADETEALNALVRALDAGLTPRQGAQALILASSHRMLAFNQALDGDPTLQDDWLNVTHCLTTSVALHQAIERGMAEPKDALRNLFLCARFVWGMHPLDGELSPLPCAEPMDTETFFACLQNGDVSRVLAGAAHLLQGGDDWLEQLLDASVRDAGIRPIVAVHIMKTLLAALDGAAVLEKRAERPVLAALRLWCLKHREFNSERLVHEAIVNVVEGGIPRTLT